MSLFPVATLGAAEGHSLIGLLLGHSWLAMSPLFELLLLANCISVFGGLGSAIFYAKGNTSVQLRISSEAAGIRVASVILAAWFGPWALWVGLPAANLYVSWRGVVASCRSVGHAPAALVTPLLVPGACAVGAGLCCWGAMRLLPINFINLFLEVTASFFLYLVALILLDRQRLMRELAESLQLIRGEPTG